jgi:hypothetical protein
MYSSLEETCTGIGDGKRLSAGSSFASSSGVSMDGSSSGNPETILAQCPPHGKLRE